VQGRFGKCQAVSLCIFRQCASALIHSRNGRAMNRSRPFSTP
jgi:hypothetical protein